MKVYIVVIESKATGRIIIEKVFSTLEVAVSHIRRQQEVFEENEPGRFRFAWVQEKVYDTSEDAGCLFSNC